MRASPIRLLKKLFGGSRSEGRRSELLSRLEHSIGYHFKDLKLLETALSHLSYIKDNGRKDTESNERLEFLGDAVLGLLVSEYLYERFQDQREGDLTRIKSSIVSRSALARRAKKLDLDRYLLYSKESFRPRDRGKATIISNCLEAVIGSIFLDGGLEACRGFLYRVILDRGQADLGYDTLQEAKNSLLHLSQVNYQCQPVYRIVGATGPEHAKHFVCEVSVKGKIYGRGEGVNKKEAEKQAAQKALQRLSLEKNLKEKISLNNIHGG